MSFPQSVPCPRGHRMVKFEAEACSLGHEHRWYWCSLRVGRTSCGEGRMVPPYGDGCNDEED